MIAVKTHRNILVCGSRDWNDVDRIQWELTKANMNFGQCRLIHGCARGADIIASSLARKRDWPVSDYRADWKKHGRAAGPIRNQEMLDIGKPDEVIAFWDGKSTGTLDMIKRATQAGVPVRIVPAAKGGA